MDITWIKEKKKGSSHSNQICIAIGFYLAPLPGTSTMYFRGIDFSESPAAAFLKTVSPFGELLASE